MVAKRILTIRMDYCQLDVTSGASFAAQMERTVESPILEVERSEYEMVIRGYQKATATQVVKFAAKVEVA